MAASQDSAPVSEEAFIILVEWPGQRSGIQKASLGDALQLMEEKSQKAINLSMGTIRAMAYRISSLKNVFLTGGSTL